MISGLGPGEEMPAHPRQFMKPNADNAGQVASGIDAGYSDDLPR
jgi:hypothetical protein